MIDAATRLLALACAAALTLAACAKKEDAPTGPSEIELLTEIQLPVVCAVRGWAAGLGFQLKERAWFDDPAHLAVVERLGRTFEPRAELAAKLAAGQTPAVPPVPE